MAIAEAIWSSIKEHKALFPEPDTHDSTYAPI